MKRHPWFPVLFCVLTIVILVVACQKAAPQLPNPIEPLPDVKTLSERLDFPVKVLTNLPGDMNEGSVTLINGELGEISYIGRVEDKNTEFTYRMKKGSAKIDGVYTEYKDTKEITLKDIPVALRMENGLVYVANWEKDGISYSFYAQEGISEELLSSLLEGPLS